MNGLQPLTPTQQRFVSNLLEALTLREKIGQTSQEICPEDIGISFERTAEWFTANPVGSVFCGGEIIKGCGGKATEIKEHLNRCMPHTRVPLLVAGDLEYGAGAAVQDLTAFPNQLALGATDNECLAYDYGKYTSLEGQLAGFNWTFSPVVDLLKNWLNPIVSTRSLGDSPARVANLAAAIIQGLQDHGMAACAKHFPGDGVDFRDQHLVTSMNTLGETAWWKSFGAVFQSVIDGGVYTIMPGHIALPWLEPRQSGQRPVPATVSKKVLTDLLRDRMGFQGVLVSDALIMAGITGWGRFEESLIQAFNAGIDVMLWPGPRYIGIMEGALEDGRVSLARLNESVRRILEMKARLGMFDSSPAEKCLETREVIEIQEAAREVSKQIAQQGITLVRNSRHLLPLDKVRVNRLLLHKAVPTGISPMSLRHFDRFIQQIEARGIEVTVLENGNCLDVCTREQNGELWDAYIVVYSLLGHQIKNTPRPVGPMAEVMWSQQNVTTMQPITISTGTPFLLYDMPFLETLINACSTSMETMDALVLAIFGEIPLTRYSPVTIHSDPWELSRINAK